MPADINCICILCRRLPVLLHAEVNSEGSGKSKFFLFRNELPVFPVKHKKRDGA